MRLSLAPRLVDRTSVASVVSIVAINFNLARLTGPRHWWMANSGLGYKLSLLVQTVCYLPFIFTISLLRPRERSSSTTENELFRCSSKWYSTRSFKHTYSSGFLSHSPLCFSNPRHLRNPSCHCRWRFSRGATGLGLLTSSAGFGALVAGVTKAFTPSQMTGELPKFALANALLGIGLLPLIGLSSSWDLTLFAFPTSDSREP